MLHQDGCYYYYTFDYFQSLESLKTPVKLPFKFSECDQVSVSLRKTLENVDAVSMILLSSAGEAPASGANITSVGSVTVFLSDDHPQSQSTSLAPSETLGIPFHCGFITPCLSLVAMTKHYRQHALNNGHFSLTALESESPR